MSTQFTRVIKVGGSLFDLPDLGERIQRWLDSHPPARNVLIAGGGWLADEIRQQSSGDDQHNHWACIEAMNAMSRKLAKLLPGAQLIEELPAAQADVGVFVFTPLAWLHRHEVNYPGTKLPASWDVTSDAIAARLAICTGAAELVLLKSADPPSRDLQELADTGYVDKFLPTLADELPPWRCVNLRHFTSDLSNRGYSQ
jgi:aspartokinase-like uncharacterized kinase